jgi:TonB-linked SusC/RagA family outer membrane protein
MVNIYRYALPYIRKSMRISAIIFCIQTCCTATLLAGTLHAQSINLNVQKVPVKEVFTAIEKQAGVSFAYNEEVVKDLPKISLKINAPLNKVLQSLSDQLPLQFKQAGDIIAVSKIVKIKNVAKPKVAETITPFLKITGNVTDEKGKPLSGASIIIRGTNRGTVTDTRGNFNLEDVPVNGILIVSFTAYISQEIEINGRAIINIQLQPTNNKLDEVQIIGYGTTSRRLSTGSESKITAEDIEKQPVNNVLAAMEGQIPGVYISQQTGVPGGNFTIQIRGQNSISSGNNPLYIIDGVPFTATTLSSNTLTSGITQTGNPLNSINPLDIESVEVLKDADATAIYGSRGSNGVVLITTKKGKAGKTDFNVNFSQGVGEIEKKMNLLNTTQYLEMRHEAFKNDGATPSLDNGDYDLLQWDTTRNTDWQKVLIGNTAHITNAQTTVSGGSEQTQFLIGVGYRDETTVFPQQFGFGDRKFSTNVNLSHSTIDKKFNITFSANYTVDNSILPEDDPTQQALVLPPDAPKIYNSDGSLNWAGSSWINPFANLYDNVNSQTNNLISNSVISYKPLQNLQIKVNLGYTRMTIDETAQYPIMAQDPAYAPLTGAAAFNNGSIETWIVEPQINWNDKLPIGDLSVLLGGTFQQNSSQSNVLYGTNYSNDDLLGTIASAGAIYLISSDYTKYRYNSIFTRINYDYEHKYLLTITGRRDGSSRFGPNRQFANFGSVGAAWIFSEEGFFKNLLSNVLSFGKLRGSYGLTGNDQIADYGFLNTYTPTSYPYQGVSGLIPSRLANADYGWETNKKTELGIELGFLSSRILLDVDYYRNLSSNQLVGITLPSITGFTSIQANLPATVQNTGIEVELNANIIKTKNLTWTTALNLSVPRNKLLAYPNLATSTNANTYTIGSSLFTKKVYEYIGVDPATGISQYVDFDGDGQITSPNDKQGLKQVAQSFYGGLQNSVRYKSISLDFTFQFVKQTGYNYTYSNGFSAPGFLGNQPTYVLSRWTQPGDHTNVQQFTESTSSAAYAAYTLSSSSLASNSISDASFVRLRNLQFSYSLSSEWFKRNHLENTKVFLQGENLFTITKFQGLDPENNGGLRLPPLRVFTIGFQLNF